ncbi:MAG TPA: hypothetical protein VHC69_17945 [Polyangiaceae bacterium]|nr:hypothetical protein [Polyangiaceae bacterium]
MRWAGFVTGVSCVLSCVSIAQAEPLGSPSGGASDLPIAVASFPADTTGIAPTKVDLDAPSATPAYAAPATPAASSVAAPSSGEPSRMDVAPGHEEATSCIESPTVLELGVLSLVRMVEQGTGLLAIARVLGPSSEEQAFDDAAAKELRRLTFMRRLAQMHDEENEREFSEKLSMYLRKREFIQALETRHLSASPFEPSAHH